MKRLHLQRRVGKSELGELRSLSPWGMGMALLLSLLLSVRGEYTQSRTTQPQASAAEYSCATGPEVTGTGRGLPV